MSRRKIILDKKVLERLYWVNNLSPYKIAKIYDCSFTTVTNRMKDYKIPFKDHSQARIKFPGKDFVGTNQEKSYMIGFRLGDLNCYKKTPHSRVLIARCHTTDKDQVKALKTMFDKYGNIKVSENKDHYHVNVHLNNSFDFLLSKKLQTKNLDLFSFVAGYTEAEGCFQINQGRARFKIDSYDTNVLKYIFKGLSKNGIEAKLRKINSKGDLRSNGTRFTHDLWRLTINKSFEIEKFILAIKPYLIHRKYVKKSTICLQNIHKREKRVE